MTSIEGMGGKARIMGALHGESIGSILKADEGSFKILGKDGAHLYTVQEMDNNKGHYKVYDAKTGQLIEGGKDLTKEGLASLFERKDLIDSHFVSDPKGMASDVADYLSGGKKWDLSSASRAAAPREYSVQVSSVQEISRGSMPSAASPETKFSPAQVKGLEELEDVRFTRYYTPEFGSLDEFLDDWSLGKKKSATRVEGWARVHLTEEQARSVASSGTAMGSTWLVIRATRSSMTLPWSAQMGLGNKNNPLEQWTVAVNKYNPRAKSGDKIVVKYYRDGSWFTKKFPIADHGSKPDLDFNAGWALVKKVNGRYVPVKPL